MLATILAHPLRLVVGALALTAALTGAYLAAPAPAPAAVPHQIQPGHDFVVFGQIEVIGEPIQPIPRLPPLDPRKVALGRKLFADKRLSRHGDIACVSCHKAEHGDADDVARSAGTGGRATAVNAPTVRDSRFSVAQFWDGRAATLEDQVDGPLLNPDEMGMRWTDVLARLRSDSDYVAAARSLYDAPFSPAVVRDAIATYERSLVSAGSRFDAFLRGRPDALTEAEKSGYRLFKDYGCAACHQGAAVGGNMFQRMGLFGDYFGERGSARTPADLGRFNVTGDPADHHVFKVPSLRNVSRTAPYLHDGSAATLEAAVAVMARYQLGRDIPAEHVQLIVAFLGSLAGDPARVP